MSSLPKYTSSPPPPLSSSSSKQSLRTIPGAQLPSRPRPIDRRSSGQLGDNVTPADQLHDPTTETTTSPPYESEPTDADDLPQPPSTSQSHFQPFFTLIEDANSSEYFHPTVHYIFSDDDTDIVTEAALRALETEQENLPGVKRRAQRNKPLAQQQIENAYAEERVSDEELDDGSSSRKSSLLPPPIPGVKDNYIILDVERSSPEGVVSHNNFQGGVAGDGNYPHHAVSGSNAATGGPRSVSTSPAAQPMPTRQQQQQQAPQFTVTSAHSLTPAWQVLNTRLVPAPTFENNASGEQTAGSGHGGLMLKIQGTAGLPATLLGKEKDKGGQRLEDMMDQFAKRMNELRRVIEAGEPVPSAEDEHLGEPGPSEPPVTGALEEETGADGQVQRANAGQNTLEDEVGTASAKEAAAQVGGES